MFTSMVGLSALGTGKALTAAYDPCQACAAWRSLLPAQCLLKRRRLASWPMLWLVLVNFALYPADARAVL